MFKRKILKVKKSLSSFAIVFGIIYIGSHGQGWSRAIGEAKAKQWTIPVRHNKKSRANPSSKTQKARR